MLVLVPFPGGVKLSGGALVVLVAYLSGDLTVASCMTPKVRFWTGLFVCSFAWGLILAGCM